MQGRLRMALAVSLLGVMLLESNIESATSHQPLASGWTRTYGGAFDDVAYSIIETGDGGYALAGRTDSLGVGSSAFWLVKIDNAGNMQWNKTYEGTGDGSQVT